MEYMRLTLKPEETKQSEWGEVQREAGGKAQNEESKSQGRVSRGGGSNRPSQIPPKAE